jgi:hypothetical protein
VRRRMLPIQVALRDERPHTLRWHDDSASPPGEQCDRVVHVIDDWDYAGRWWDLEVVRQYLLVETARGVTLEIFREGEAWCLSRTSD